MSFFTFSRRIIRNIEDYGALSASKKALAYCLKPFYEKKVYRIYGIELENAEVREVDRDCFAFKIINKEDTEIVKQIEAMEEWLHGKLEEKLKRKGLCLVILDKERVVGFNLISFGEVYIPLLKLRKVFMQDEAWSEQITIHKDYRQRGLASKLRYRIFLELKKKGIKKLYGGALRNNEPSLKLARKVGFKELTDVHFLKFFGHKHYGYHQI